MPLIICQKQSFADVFQKKFLKNFNLCVAGLSPISEKITCTGVSFPCEISEIFKNTHFYRAPFLSFKSQSFRDLTVQFQMCLLLLAALCILFKETIARTISSVVARSAKKAF